MRNFESKNIPNNKTKDYLNKLWDEFCKEIPRRFNSDIETIEDKKIKLDKEFKKKTKELKNIREQRRRIKR